MNYTSASATYNRPKIIRSILPAMGVEISILVGTMTGTAEMVAQEVQQALETAGHRANIQVMDNLDASVFQIGGRFLVCTSTYGNGDVPDNAQALFGSLESEKPDLSNITYGVIALGDRTYKDTFCQGGIRFDKILTELGARRAGDMMMHDAGSGTLPEELAAQWAVTWVEQQLDPSSETV
jgi:MioC protein